MCPTVVVLQPDPELRDLVVSTARHRAGARPCRTAAEAIAELRSCPRVSAVVTDVEVPGGCGLELIRTVLRDRPGTSCLVLTGSGDVRKASEASRLGADFVSTCDGTVRVRRRIERFVHGLLAQRRVVTAAAEMLASRHGLTPAEREVLLLTVRGLHRAELSDHLGITDNSVRTRVRGVCRKLEVPRLDGVFQTLFYDLATRWSESVVERDIPARTPARVVSALAS